MGRHIALKQVTAGSLDHAAALVGLAGLGAIPALLVAGAPPAMLRAAIGYAVVNHYRELPGLDRAAFAGWCRAAEFAAPAGTPETFDIYRGTVGVSPADAARGWHWSLSFDDAAYYGCRYADAALTGVVVIRARVRRDEIAAWIAGTAHSELIPAETPAEFETMTDHGEIGDTAVRAAHRYEALIQSGEWRDNGSRGLGQHAAMAARARMAAAGVPRGTAIVG